MKCVQFNLALCLLLIITTDACSADWPHWRGPTRDSRAGDPGFVWDFKAHPPKQIWKAAIGIGFSSIVIANGRVYSMGNIDAHDHIWCLNAETGAVVWKHAYPSKLQPNLYEGGPNATPTLDADRVYTVGKFGQIFCLDATSGKVIWTRDASKDPGCTPPKWGVSGSPLINGQNVIFNLGASGLALDKLTGSIVWKSENLPCGYSTPLPITFKGMPAVAIYAGTEMVIVDPTTGARLWSYKWINPVRMNAPDPLFIDDKVFLGGGSDLGCALIPLNEDKPRPLWRNSNLCTHTSTPLTFDGCIFGLAGPMATCELRCIDAADGSIKWKFAEGGTLLRVNGKTLLLSTSGELIVGDMTSKGFNEITRASILDGKCWTMPAIAGKRIYVRNAKTALVCVELTSK